VGMRLRFPKGVRQFKGDHEVYDWYREGPYANPPGVALMALEKWLYDRIDAGESIVQTLQKILGSTTSVAFLGVLSAVGRKEPKLLTGPLKPLLSAFEIHEWELIDSFGSQDYFAMAWLQRSDRERKLAQEWSSLPHRRLGFREVAQFLFLNVPSVGEFLKTVRRDWARRAATLPKGDERAEQLRLLMARFDKRNYRVKYVPERGNCWEFKLPESLTANDDKAIAAEESLMALTFKSQCRRILDQGEPLPEDQLESFWVRIEAISGIDCKRDSYDYAVDPYASVCGGIAVLVRFHRDWLKAYPAREKWCVERVAEALVRPVVSDDLDTSRSTFDLYRESFLAELLPLLWAEDVADASLRQCVAQLAFSLHYKTVAILCRSASRVREVLGCDFSRLLHLILRWAVVRLELEIARNHGVRSLPEQQAEVDAWVRGEIAAFVRGELSAKPPTWDKLLEGEKTPQAQDANVRAIIGYMPRPALDEELVLASLSWMPSLDAALDDRERIQWTSLWREALGYALRSLEPDRREEPRDARFPFDSERLILEKIASLVLEMHEGEHPEQFWKPILELGAPGQHWIGAFLGAWFRLDLPNNGARTSFLRTWRGMFEHAHASPAWTLEAHDVEENSRQLMGLDWLTTSFDNWGAEKKAVVSAIADAYEQWARDHLHEPQSAVLFSAFLARPGAEPLILSGLSWLKSAAERCGDDFWARDDMTKQLVVLLDRCVRMYMREIDEEPSALSAFRFLLKELVERRVPSAMALQESLAHREWGEPLPA